MNDLAERLKAENDKLIHDIQAPDGYTWEWHCQRKDEEIERLRKTLDDHLDSEAAETRRADRERARARAAEAEIERLKAVLEEIAEGTAATWISDRVREALGE